MHHHIAFDIRQAWKREGVQLSEFVYDLHMLFTVFTCFYNHLGTPWGNTWFDHKRTGMHFAVEAEKICPENNNLL